MASWYSNILTTTTSRISNLRSTLLGGDADGDTEDDTHVCRVLRAYYAEKGRPFPPWLPPDPKAPPPPVASAMPAGPGVGSRYGGGNLFAGSGGAVAATAAPQPSGLSSLWDSGAGGGGAAGGPPAPAPTASLRQTARVSPFSRNSDPAAAAAGIAPRPLPSQRLGSYQSTAAAAAAPPSAQDKLRNLFNSGGSSAGGSRSNSPAQHGGGGGGGRPYGRNSGGGGAGSERPFVAANAPWASDESEYPYSGGGGGGGGGQSGGGRRQGGGLPSGPRMR